MQRPIQSVLSLPSTQNSFTLHNPSNITMATSENPKDMMVVNYQEIPETVCVETRFVTHAVAKQMKNEDFYYVRRKNGQMELIKGEENQSANYKYNMANKPSVTVSIRQKKAPPANLSTSSTTGIVKLPTNPLVPLATALSNFNNTNDLSVVNNLPVKPTIPIPTVAKPISNTSQLHNYNMNTTVFPHRKLVETKDTESMTDPSPKYCDQLQQTDDSTPKTVSIAIQCQMSEEVEETFEWSDNVEEEPSTDPLDIDVEKDDFLTFVKENSIQYQNRLRECLICGEICKKSKYFYGHMNIHRGPKILCFKCGQYLDHKSLLNNHYCQQSKQMEKAFLRCPHYYCGVLAISRLELYDHINEHTKYRMHKCSVCQEAFCTTQEFLRHILLRAKCYTGAKLKRFRLYGLESHKDRLCRVRVFTLHTDKRRTTLVKSFLSQRKPKQSICRICLKPYRNNFVLNRHYYRCLAMFRKRLMRKNRRRTANN